MGQNKTLQSDLNAYLIPAAFPCPAPWPYFRHGKSQDAGLTLVELVLVVVLLALITTLAVTRLDSITGWKLERDLRQFAGTWEFLYNESFARGEAYRLILNLDEDYYYVRREVPLSDNEGAKVDLLANLRLKSEKERRAKKEEEELLTLEEEFTEDDAKQNLPLERQFYDVEFNDPESAKRLARPLEFPSLADRQELSEGLGFRDVRLEGEAIKEGTVSLHLSPGGTAQFAVVHLNALDTVYTIVIHPATGKVSIMPGDKDYEVPFNKESQHE